MMEVNGEKTTKSKQKKVLGRRFNKNEIDDKMRMASIGTWIVMKKRE